MVESFLLAFIPLFVAIDPVGTIPMFLGMTDGFNAKERRRLACEAVLTALLAGLCFGAAGHYIFSFLGITAADFRIAGGLLLLIFSIREIFGNTPRRTEGEQETPDNVIGIVPLGIPILAGPAMITTLLILHDEHNFAMIAAALIANLAIALFLFIYSQRIIAKIGDTVPKVTAKVVAIFLAAIGIMMIRRGLETFFQS